MRSARLLLCSVLLGLAACGLGDGRPESIQGPWWLTRYVDGVAQDPIHLTVAQSGSDIQVRFSCDDTSPVGIGSYLDGTFGVLFDFGGGDTAHLQGLRIATGIVGTFNAGPESGTFLMVPAPSYLDCSMACAPVAPLRFVDTSFTELDKIERISLFRSSAGHSYVDGCETCRSMKHYFAPYAAWRMNDAVEVYAPVNGTIVSIQDEGHGASVGDTNKQVRIRSSAHPDYTFVLFHVDLTAPVVTPGSLVTAGQVLGHARLEYPDIPEVADNFDIGVRVHTAFGERFVSWFDVLTDAAFAAYVARGASARSDFVISEAARDADPLTCDGEAFTSTGTLNAWVMLDPP